MKAIVVLAMFGACILGMTSAFDAACNGKIQQFKECHKKIRDQHEQESKTKEAAIGACYSVSSCSPPGPGGKPKDADHEKKGQCMKEIQAGLKVEVQKCVQGKQPSLLLPQENHGDDKHGPGGPGGFKGGHGDKGIEQACSNDAAKVAAVKACIKAHASGSGSDPKARFDANCKSKHQCDGILDAKCKTDLEAAHKSICECNQQLHADAALKAKVRAASPSCAGQTEPAQHQGGPSKQGKQKSCDDVSTHKDPCEGTYEQWQAARKGQQGQHGPRPGDDGH